MGDLQQWLTDFLANLGTSLPFGYAFAVGMVSTVNPCGFAMLPAYLGLYLGTRDGPPGAGDAGVVELAAKAILVTLVITAGFVVLFGGAGLAISAGGRFIIDTTPWIALGVGVILVLLGTVMLFGRELFAGFGARLTPRVGNPASMRLWGFFVFGIAYAVASLSCTLPLFLVVVGGSLTADTLVASTGQYVLYALGMGSIILVVTIALAVFRGALVDRLMRIAPYVERTSAVLLIFAGGYIVYYWLIKGGLLDQFA